ncbi:putative FHA domain containing protein [Gloeothece citriformis PCC 7424]|uniref:Putative FHA domain containing protein n=1 Tax=Gloeothece citriformis (strain PCC 7424) TaxID=65393 RepID=B7K973_GLOC7|nr:hypothetical protein [Gloeothece citriformis]ACK68556.1 putative FHA domain containing protein [Gloeothece citriformis PCC 7424]
MLTQSSKKWLIPISLSTLLTCTAITWIATTAINPSITLAKSTEFNIPIYRQPQESYEELLQRAEKLAKVTIDTRLKQDPSLDEIKVIIVGENQGAIAPLLMVKATRQGWINRPQVRPWATYFTDSRLLLGFDQPEVTPEPNQPTPQPPTAENPTPQPPQSEQPPQPQPLPLIEVPTQERQRNPLPVPTQRLRNAGNQLPFVDPVDTQQLRPDLLN